MTITKQIKLYISIILALIVWFLPSEAFPFELTIVEQRVAAIFVLAASLWITEAIAIWTTSVMVIVLMHLSVSTSSFKFMLPPAGSSSEVLSKYGTFIYYKNIMATFADPIIMLFMGGFVLAIAASKYKLDAGLAKALLKPFGTNANMVLLGFIIMTAIFSMFMSNTATAAMMLTILSPVLASLRNDVKSKIALAMSIPIAANIGGIGTPIGTPPNAIAIKYIADTLGADVSFFGWMMIMVPIMLIILLFSWWLLKTLFKFEQREIKIELTGEFEKSPKAYIVYVTFAITILLWISDKFTGVNANVVALIPFAVFSVTGVITKDDLKLIDWDVLWLVAGGFALGVGLNETGLAKNLVEHIPFNSYSVLTMMIGAGLLCYAMSTFMSNTATAALLIPILAAAGMSMQGTLESFGGIHVLLISLALSASLAMALPISTPPNALAYAKGFIKQKDMAIVGIIIGAFGMIVGYWVLIILGKFGLLSF
ncbi:DASS family sodium/dicarboxylate symporter [Campylobacter iguaniorum]|uniref:SLC13 family permease n=1 Tax=Campylobacter iguaniorum TaxID=1244531 RepID=UPI00073A9DBB|nr:SLC13 family permease [Campylobacter iguaniorum]ALV24434.1 DASS family sodium/dicarboxylate symporter [Campylobacter iguaniorum]